MNARALATAPRGLRKHTKLGRHLIGSALVRSRWPAGRFELKHHQHHQLDDDAIVQFELGAGPRRMAVNCDPGAGAAVR